eukprot:6122512-Pyramimonas_sp.AAC.1
MNTLEFSAVSAKSSTMMRGISRNSSTTASSVYSPRLVKRCSTRFTNKVRLQKETYVNEVAKQISAVPRRNVLQYMAAGSVAQATQAVGAVASPSPPTWRQGSEWKWNGHTVRWSVLGADKPGTPCEFPALRTC